MAARDPEELGRRVLRMTGGDVAETRSALEVGPPAPTPAAAEFTAFPQGSKGSALRQLLPNGDNVLNFKTGSAKLADGSEVNMTHALGELEADAFWSLFMWLDNDCTVQTRTPGVGLSAPFFIDQCTYAVIEGWPFTQLNVQPKGGFDVRTYLVASSFPRVAFDRYPITTHQERQVTGFTTTNNYETIKTQHLLNFNRKSLRVENVGSNAADVRFQSRVFGSLNWHTDYELSDQASADEPELAAGDSFRFTTTDFAHVFRARARSTADGSHTDLNYEGGGVSG